MRYSKDGPNTPTKIWGSRRDYTYNGGSNTCLAVGGIKYYAANTSYYGGDTHAGICHIKRNEVGVIFTTNGSR